MICLLPVLVPVILIHSLGRKMHNVQVMKKINEKKMNPDIFGKDETFFIYDNNNRKHGTYIYARDSTCTSSSERTALLSRR